MADIELIIKMPEKMLNDLRTCKFPIKDAYRLCHLIENGIILPKGHGRLIDVNALLDQIGLEDNDYNRDVDLAGIISLEDIDMIPTIIEADEE